MDVIGRIEKSPHTSFLVGVLVVTHLFLAKHELTKTVIKINGISIYLEISPVSFPQLLLFYNQMRGLR